jgi:hypothetical protein
VYGREQVELTGGFHQFASYGRGEFGAIATVFDYDGEREPLFDGSTIGNISGEPGMRISFIELSGAGFPSDIVFDARHG